MTNKCCVKICALALILFTFLCQPIFVAKAIDFSTTYQVTIENDEYVFSGQIAEKAGYPYAVLVESTAEGETLDVTQGITEAGGTFNFRLPSADFSVGSDVIVRIISEKCPDGIRIQIVDGVVKGTPVLTKLNLFVSSTKGDDTAGDGTKSRPFATIGRAQEAVRAAILQKSSLTDYTVNIAAGIYPELPLSFTEKDTLAGGSVTYQGDGDAVILGADAVQPSAWSPHNGNIYVAEVGAGREIDTLYADGKMLTKARYPNAVGNVSADYLKNLGIKDADGNYVYNTMAFKDGDLPSGLENTDGLEVSYWGGGGIMWSNNTSKATITYENCGGTGQSYDGQVFGTGGKKATGAGIITITTPYIHTSYRLKPDSLYYLQGAYAFLDSPGEFFYDSEEGKLYRYIANDSELSKTVYIPVAKDGISIKGSSNEKIVQNLSFKNLTIEGTKRTDAVAVKLAETGNGFTVSNADNVTISGCRICSVGGTGIALVGTVNDIHIHDNELASLGFAGISLKPEAAFTSITSLPECIADNIEIRNNYIHNGGVLRGDANGVYINHPGAGNLLITHNKIEDFRRCGIICGNFMFDNKSYVISYNEISDVMNGSEDGGVIYYQEITDRELGPGGTPLIQNNYLHDNSVYKGSGSVLYLDDASYKANAEGNLIVNNNQSANAAGMFKNTIMAKGDDITIRNNYVHNNRENYFVNSYSMQDRYDANRLTVENNVFSGEATDENATYKLAKDTADKYALTSRIASADNNLFYREGADALTVLAAGTLQSFADWWQAENINKDDMAEIEPAFDENSVIGVSPQFKNAAAGDYRLVKSSPALMLGTKDLDLQSMGLEKAFPFVPAGEELAKVFVRKTGDVVNPSFYELPLGGSLTLETLLRSENGFVLTADELSFSSDNTEVATVSATGEVAAVSSGKAVITITAEVDDTIISTTIDIEVSDNQAVWVTNLSITNAQGNPADLTEEEIYISGYLNSDEPLTVLPIYALYREQGCLSLVKPDGGSYTLTAGTPCPFEMKIEKPKDLDCSQLRIFIWDNLTGMQPLAKRIDYPEAADES